MPQLNKKTLGQFIIGATIISGILVRLRGLLWGFPYLYHPDEPVLVRTAMGFRYTGFNPNHFDWPTLHMYLNYIVYEIFIKARAVINSLDLSKWVIRYYPLLYNDDIVFYFISRLISIAMAGATFYLIYRICRLLKFTAAFSWLAVILLVLSPVHLTESPLATLDVPLTFWLTLTLFLSYLSILKKNLRFLILSGLTAGLATSTKYNGGLGVLLILPALLHLIPPQTWRSRASLKLILFVILATAGGFVMGTPYVLLDAETFFSATDPSGALWQFTRGGNSFGLSLFDRFWSRLVFDLGWSVGFITILLAALGMIKSIQKKSLVSWLIPYTLFYALAIIIMNYYQPHFLLPLIVPLILLAVYFVSGLKSNLVKVILGSLLILSVIPSAVRQIYISGREDTRTTMVKYIQKSIPTGQKILMGDAYEPILEEKDEDWDGQIAYELFTFRDYPGKFNRDYLFTLLNDDIHYILIADFGLGDKFDHTAPADNRDELAWLRKYGVVEKRIEPVNVPGPSVLLFKLNAPENN